MHPLFEYEFLPNVDDECDDDFVHRGSMPPSQVQDNIPILKTIKVDHNFIIVPQKIEMFIIYNSSLF